MPRWYSKPNALLRMVLFVTLAGGTTATASVLLDTGVVTFAPTGTQFGRISRDGTASIWGVVKPFPGTIGGPTARAYEAFTVDTGDYPFIQISLDDPTASLFMAAYLSSFNPVNVPPNYGLDVNYLGDPGSTQPFDSPSWFQIEVAPHTQLVIPVNELNPGGGAGQSFELLVEGFADSSFGEFPEPSSLILCGAGLLALYLRGVRARRRNDGGSHQ